VPLARLGDYELLEEIGRGGMGIVYRARQVSLDRTVAVKLLPFGGLGGPEAALRLRAEAVAAGSLRHPNIVAIHEVALHQGQNFLAMDFVAGPSLARVLRDGPLPAQRAAMLMRQVALAVQHAHDRGIIHRDLKPSKSCSIRQISQHHRLRTRKKPAFRHATHPYGPEPRLAELHPTRTDRSSRRGKPVNLECGMQSAEQRSQSPLPRLYEI
jgi:hypothetical protein